MADCQEHTHIFRYNGITVTVGHLDVRAIDKLNGRRRCFQLLQDFQFDLQFRGGKLQVIAPAGYETDYASIPFLLGVVLGGRDAPGTAEAAVVHDWCCSIHLERFLANALMRIVLTAYGVPYWKVLAYFGGLMLVGYQSPPYRLACWLSNTIKRRFKCLKS